MNLDDAQRKAVTAWIDEGLKLAEIQQRLEKEFGLRVTYLDVRMLVDDLKLTPKDPEVPKPAVPPEAPAEKSSLAGTEPAPIGAGKVSVSVDAIARPGSMVSGNVTFGDGQSATWYLDPAGRLGLAPAQQGYRPSEEDVRAFQLELQTELQRMGM